MLLLPCLYALFMMFMFLSTSSMHDVDVCVYTESEDGTRKLTYIHQCS